MPHLIPQFIHQQFLQGVTHDSLQAATLFVDISGFTPLTERLFHYKRDGAETLSSVLNAVLGPLVRAVHDYGGMIPLFAGDAFTAIFMESELGDAADRALFSASLMRQYFAAAGDVKPFVTKYGEFGVGIKIGLSYGEVEWGIPGRHGEYSFYFRGAAVMGAAQAQRQAERGQIVVDEAIWTRLPNVIQARPLDVGFHLIEKVVELGRPCPIPLIDLTRHELKPFISDSILNLPLKAEFREICAVFISFEEGVAAPALHNYVGEMIAQASAHGGTFSQIEIGEKGGVAVILFGAPVSFENDVARAAEFLLALKQATTKMPDAPRWRSGVTYGTVWAGMRGAAERCEYGAVGDIVNTASRLSHHGDWGEIWVSDVVYRILSDDYWVGAIGSFKLKGKQEHINVYRLLRRKETAAEGSYRGEMVGRVEIIEQLNTFIQPILEKRCAGVITIYGDPGMGKSSLIRAFQRQAMRRHYLSWFFCAADGIQGGSLHPFKSFLHSYFQQIDDLPPKENRSRFDEVLDLLIAQLPEVGPDGVDLRAELERGRSMLAAFLGLHWDGEFYSQVDLGARLQSMIEAFRSLVKAASLMLPVILHLEDWHSFDGDSRELVRALLVGAEAYPVTLIITSRYLDNGKRDVVVVDGKVPQGAIDLPSLTHNDMRTLVTQIIGGSITDEALAYFVHKSGGNPFFIEQLVVDISEQNLLRLVVEEEGPVYSLPATLVKQVPSTLSALLVARLDRLAADVRQVVHMAAVLGNEFDVPILGHMLADNVTLAERLAAAEAAQIWIKCGPARYQFIHPLLRDAAYEMQLGSRLRELHQKAAEAIEVVYANEINHYCTELAYHYAQADIVDLERQYITLAGHIAASKYENDKAITYLSRALELVDERQLAERFDLILLRESIYGTVGERKGQAADLLALHKLATLMDDPVRCNDVVIRQAWFAFDTGDFENAIAAACHLIETAAESQDAHTEAVGYLIWGRVLWRRGHYFAALPHIERALELARGERDRQIESECLRTLGVIYGQLGQRDAAVADLEQSLALARLVNDQVGIGACLNNLATCYADEGNMEGARRYLEAARQAYKKVGNIEGEVLILHNLGCVAHNQGAFAEAKQQLLSALQLARLTADKQGEGELLADLANAFRDLGQHDHAKRLYQQSLTICRDIGDRQVEAYCLANYGLMLWYIGQFEEAQRACQRALDVAKSIGSLPDASLAWQHLGLIMDTMGKGQAAVRAFRKSVEHWQQISRPHRTLGSLAGIARVALQHKNSVQALEAVEQIFEYLPKYQGDNACERSQIYLTCYEVLRDFRDERATLLLHAAYHWLQNQAHNISDPMVRHSFLSNIPANRAILHEFEVAQLGRAQKVH